MNLVAREYAMAARRKLVETADEDPRVLLARADDREFCEFCFTDDQAGGAPIVQAPHHLLWWELTAKHAKLVTWFPIEHGKTTQVKFKLCRLLGQHPDRQYGYFTSKGDQAKKMVKSVRGEIEANVRLQQVYPDLKPQRQVFSAALKEWGETSFRVEGCPRGSKDASLTGYGLDGSVLGARLHGAIIDNALDSENTNTAYQRRKVIQRFKDEIFGRTMRGGFIWFLDTAWMHDDALHYFAKRPGWESVRLDATVPLREGDRSLWPAQWPPERLEAKRTEELGDTAFDRQFRNRPLSESMGIFKREAWDLSYGRVPWVDSWIGGALPGFTLQAELVTGVDLASGKRKTRGTGGSNPIVGSARENDQAAFSTVLASGHRRRLVNLQAGRLTFMEVLARMVSIYRNIHRPVNLAGGNARFVVEDNATQEYVVNALRSASILRGVLNLTPEEAGDIRVTGRTTTSEKRDLELGIPALAAGLEMGRWDVAPHQETETLWDEMRVWTPAIAEHTGDRLMATWIAMASMMEAAAGSFRVDNF